LSVEKIIQFAPFVNIFSFLFFLILFFYFIRTIVIRKTKLDLRSKNCHSEFFYLVIRFAQIRPVGTVADSAKLLQHHARQITVPADK